MVAATNIFSPHDKEIEYQNGRTDKNGCFSFIPDDTGTWTVVINDGTDHGDRIEIPVKKNMEVDFRPPRLFSATKNPDGYLCHMGNNSNVTAAGKEKATRAKGEPPLQWRTG